MLETHIKILATLYTALLMATVSYVLLFAGFNIKHPKIKGQIIQATMVDISQLNSNKKTKKEEKKQPKKQPEKKDPPKQEPVKKDPPKQEPVKKDPPKKDPPKKEVKKVDPVKKDPPRIVKKTPVVDTKAQERERKKAQERKKKLEEIQKKRQAAKKRAEQAEKDLIDLANKTKETQPVETQPIGNTKGQSDANKKQQLLMRYQLAIFASVKRQWNKPASANDNLLCHVKVRQIPGGAVIDATISSPCNANTIVKNSIIAAVKKADPLPYKGFESVFSRNATFIFKPSSD